MEMDQLDSIIRQVFKIPQGQLRDDATVDDVRGWDSLSHMDLIARIEAEYDIELTGDEIADMQSIGAIRSIVESHRKG